MPGLSFNLPAPPTPSAITGSTENLNGNRPRSQSNLADPYSNIYSATETNSEIRSKIYSKTEEETKSNCSSHIRPVAQTLKKLSIFKTGTGIEDGPALPLAGRSASPSHLAILQQTIKSRTNRSGIITVTRPKLNTVSSSITNISHPIRQNSTLTKSTISSNFLSSDRIDIVSEPILTSTTNLSTKDLVSDRTAVPEQTIVFGDPQTGRTVGTDGGSGADMEKETNFSGAGAISTKNGVSDGGQQDSATIKLTSDQKSAARSNSANKASMSASTTPKPCFSTLKSDKRRSTDGGSEKSGHGTPHQPELPPKSIQSKDSGRSRKSHTLERNTSSSFVDGESFYPRRTASNNLANDRLSGSNRRKSPVHFDRERHYATVRPHRAPQNHRYLQGVGSPHFFSAHQPMSSGQLFDSPVLGPAYMGRGRSVDDFQDLSRHGLPVFSAAGEFSADNGYPMPPNAAPIWHSRSTAIPLNELPDPYIPHQHHHQNLFTPAFQQQRIQNRHFAYRNIFPYTTLHYPYRRSYFGPNQRESGPGRTNGQAGGGNGGSPGTSGCEDPSPGSQPLYNNCCYVANGYSSQPQRQQHQQQQQPSFRRGIPGQTSSGTYSTRSKNPLRASGQSLSFHPGTLSGGAGGNNNGGLKIFDILSDDPHSTMIPPIMDNASGPGFQGAPSIYGPLQSACDGMMGPGGVDPGMVQGVGFMPTTPAGTTMGGHGSRLFGKRPPSDISSASSMSSLCQRRCIIGWVIGLTALIIVALAIALFIQVSKDAAVSRQRIRYYDDNFGATEEINL